LARSSTSFAPGNQAALKHGFRSSVVRAQRRRELAQELRDLVLGRWPHLVEQGPILDLLIEGLADCRQLRDYMNGMGGPVSVKGKVYGAMEMLRHREHDVLAVARDLLLPLRELARLGPAAGLAPVRLLDDPAAQVQRLRAESSNGEGNGHAH